MADRNPELQAKLDELEKELEVSPEIHSRASFQSPAPRRLLTSA